MRVRSPAALIPWLALGVLVAVVVVSELRAAPPSSYSVVVHPANPLTAVDQKFLQELFLKKVTRWPDGTIARPADLGANSAIRQSFSENVLHRSVAAVRAYWQQRIFSGRDVPPPELIEEAAVAHVLKYEGAVTYVSTATDTRGAKTLSVTR